MRGFLRWINQPAVLLAFLSFCIAPAPINYGDFSDIPPGSVMYLDVTESASFPDDKEPLFGPPSITADTLNFDPLDVFSAGFGSSDSTGGRLSFTLTSSETAITDFMVTSAGLYTLSGEGTSATNVSCLCSISELNILEVDGIPVATPIVLPGTEISETFDLSSGAATDATWTNSLTLEINAALQNAGFGFEHGATKIGIVVENLLTSASETSSDAMIGLTAISLSPTTMPAFIPGDVNGDGVVNLEDVAPFVDLLMTGNFLPAADVNGDGIVDLLDVQPFVDLLTGA